MYQLFTHMYIASSFSRNSLRSFLHKFLRNCSEMHSYDFYMKYIFIYSYVISTLLYTICVLNSQVPIKNNRETSTEMYEVNE